MSNIDLEGKNTTNNVLTHKGTKVFHRRNKVKALLATISLIGGFGIGIGIGWGIFHPTSSIVAPVNITFTKYDATMDAPVNNTPVTQTITAVSSDGGNVTLTASGPSGNNWNFSGNTLTYSTAFDQKTTITIIASEKSSTSSIRVDLLPETSPTPTPSPLTENDTVYNFFMNLDEKEQPGIGEAPTTKELFWSLCYTCYGTLYKEVYSSIEYHPDDPSYDTQVQLWNFGTDDEYAILNFSEDYTHVKLTSSIAYHGLPGFFEAYYTSDMVTIKLGDGNYSLLSMDFYPKDFVTIENIDTYDNNADIWKENGIPVELECKAYEVFKLCYPYYYEIPPQGDNASNDLALIKNYFTIFYDGSFPWPFN